MRRRMKRKRSGQKGGREREREREERKLVPRTMKVEESARMRYPEEPINFF